MKVKEREIILEDDLIKRLNKIEGQIKGIKNMISDKRYCVDVLTQVSAVNEALRSVTNLLLKDHMNSCMKNDILKGKYDSIDEVATLFKRFQ